jgi:hypothetical protein
MLLRMDFFNPARQPCKDGGKPIFAPTFFKSKASWALV